MQTRLNTKVPNENLYHPGPSWHRQQLQMSPLAQLRGTFASLVHTLLPNPCLVEFEECSDVQATPSTVMVPSSPKLFCWKCPKPVKNVPWDWVDYSPPPSSLLFLSLSRGTGQLRLTTLRHVRTQPGQEGKWIICSGRSGLQDSYLEKKKPCTSPGAWWRKKILAKSSTSKQDFFGVRSKISFIFIMIFLAKKK